MDEFMKRIQNPLGEPVDGLAEPTDDQLVHGDFVVMRTMMVGYDAASSYMKGDTVLMNKALADRLIEQDMAREETPEEKKVREQLGLGKAKPYDKPKAKAKRPVKDATASEGE